MFVIAALLIVVVIMTGCLPIVQASAAAVMHSTGEFLSPVGGFLLTQAGRHTEWLPGDYALGGFPYNLAPWELDLRYYYFMLAAALLFLIIIAVVVYQFYRISRERDASDKRYHSICQAAPLAFIVTDLHQRIIEWNPAAERIFGWTQAEALGRNLYELLIPEQASAYVRHRIDQVLTHQAFNHAINRNYTKDGIELLCEWHNMPYYDHTGECVGMLSIGEDITARIEAERQLRFIAQHDTLTQLPNRAVYADRLKQAMASARRSGLRAAVMLLDLDHFRVVDDDYGHEVGDLVLQQIAQRLAGTVRESDTVARIGGDEFIILLPDVNTENTVMAVAERLRHVCNRPFSIQGQDISLSCSIGIALYPDHSENEIELAKLADVALCLAKQQGRNRIKMAMMSAPVSDANNHTMSSAADVR